MFETLNMALSGTVIRSAKGKDKPYKFLGEGGFLPLMAFVLQAIARYLQTRGNSRSEKEQWLAKLDATKRVSRAPCAYLLTKRKKL